MLVFLQTNGIRLSPTFRKGRQVKSSTKAAASRTATATPPSAQTANELSPLHSTMVTSRRDNDGQSLALYESAGGVYFVHKLDETGEHIIPITPAAAGKILALETKRKMSRIFKRQLEIPARATLDDRRIDTAKDELVWSECDDDVEAAAVYRTASGVEYLRLINPWRDVVVLFARSRWAEIQASVREWVCCNRSFLTLIDWPHDCKIYGGDCADSNNESYDITPWLPRGLSESSEL